MEKTETLIVGGGASGLFCALLLKSNNLIVLERGERVGRKLSATGNGQGNVGNESLSISDYFCKDAKKVGAIIERYPTSYTLGKMEERGAVFTSDERGRIYPAGKQASAVTDTLRFALSADGKKTLTGYEVKAVEKKGEFFIVTAMCGEEKKQFSARNLVFATGGKSAKNFGTDGSAYELIKKLGHSVTPLCPSLVQLKTDTDFIKGLKGVRVQAKVTAKVSGKEIATEKGDLIFTDYGVSGDAIFRISAFVTDKKEKVTLTIDFAPEVDDQTILRSIERKKATGKYEMKELLSGILPSALGRAVCKRANESSGEKILKNLRAFTLEVKGSLGFDYAQVTKGGVPLDEVTDSLESKKVKNLYIVGEALDVDGKCGGYNLQWAFSSASAVANEINAK